MREIFYTFNASAPPADPTVNSTKYTTPLTYPVGGGYYKAIAREDGIVTAVTSKSFERGAVLDYWKYYSFDGNANDANGVENATLTGTTSYIAGKNGQALQTNAGATNYARITMPTGDYSVSLWQLLSGTGTGQPLSIASSTGSGIPNFVFMLDTNNGIVATYSTYMQGSFSSQLSYPVTQWNHLVITKEGSVHKFYLNNVLVRTASSAFDQTYLYLGNAYSTYNNLKSFDLTRIYQRAITASEVTEIYNSEV